jgi:hypothetical protein
MESHRLFEGTDGSATSMSSPCVGVVGDEEYDSIDSTPLDLIPPQTGTRLSASIMSS